MKNHTLLSIFFYGAHILWFDSGTFSAFFCQATWYHTNILKKIYFYYKIQTLATFCYFQFSSPSLGLWMWWPQGSYICLTRWLQDFPGIASYLCYLRETYGRHVCSNDWILHSLIIFQFSKDPDSRSSRLSNKVMVIIYMNLIESKLFIIPKQG